MTHLSPAAPTSGADRPGGASVRQAPRLLTHAGHDTQRSAAPPVLLSPRQVAEAFQVSERHFETLRRQPWMPKPVLLGPKTYRWIRSEIEAAVLSLPRTAPQVGRPTQLAEGLARKVQPQAEA